MESFDYIIAGGGCAGLSLAYHLTREGLGNRSILIIDREVKQTNDRTWCFWNKTGGDFQELIHRQWPQLAFADEKGELEPAMEGFRYQMLRSADFYGFIHRHLRQFPNIHFKYGYISNLYEDASGPCALVDGEEFRGKWIFNSCFHLSKLKAKADSHHFLLQHFKGWQINCRKPVFDPERAMLMDFRVDQKGAARFFYVLPLSERQALVEFTVFSPERLPDSEYNEALEKYIREQLKVENFEITETEQGAIPMTDMTFKVRQSPHILNIGTPAGAVKPTTGYAFQNIQRQTRALARQLIRQGEPHRIKSGRPRFRFYDTLLLHILERYGEQAAPVFSRLFRHNPMGRVLTFLNEQSTWWQEARIFAFLPKRPFLRALLEINVQTRKQATAPMVQKRHSA